MPQQVYSQGSGTLAVDSLPAPRDTLPKAADTLAAAEPVWGTVIEMPPAPVVPAEVKPTGLSWSVLLLLIPAFIVALKTKNSPKFIAYLWQDLIAVRDRHSIFDTTLRESTYLFFLLVMASVSGGILLSMALPTDWTQSGGISSWLEAHLPSFSASIPIPLVIQLICILVVMLYLGAMWCAYNISGSVFDPGNPTKQWAKGYTASMGLLAIPWVVCALVGLGQPEWHAPLLYVAGTAFIIAKLLFIWKGLRIFFRHNNPGLVFLYYLCSLEIVPVILICNWAKNF